MSEPSGSPGNGSRGRVVQRPAKPFVQGQISSLRSIITRCKKQAATLEMMTANSLPTKAAYFRELAEEFRDVAHGVSELLLKIEKFRAEMDSQPED
jgi:hypothetical protein